MLPASLLPGLNPVFCCVWTPDFQADFRDYPPLLRQAVSVARKIQDPLVEYSQVCSSDEDILCLKLHPLQVAPPPDAANHLTTGRVCQSTFLESAYSILLLIMDTYGLT